MFLSLNFFYLSASFKEMPCTLTITDPKLLHGKCFKLWNILSSNKSPERGIPHQVSSDRLQSNCGVLKHGTVYYVKSTQTTNQHHIYTCVLSQRHRTTDTNVSKSETSGPKHFCFCVAFETSHLHSPSWSQAFLCLCYCFWDRVLTIWPRLVLNL